MGKKDSGRRTGKQEYFVVAFAGGENIGERLMPARSPEDALVMARRHHGREGKKAESIDVYGCLEDFDVGEKPLAIWPNRNGRKKHRQS